MAQDFARLENHFAERHWHELEIGFNGEVPRQVIALPPCDPANPLSIPATARTFIPVTADTASTTIRLTFVGGETSDIRTYPRPK